MTVKVAPEFWLNQGPATDIEANKLHTTAAAFRRMVDGLYGGRQGVVLSRGTCQDLKVTATGADVNITVRAGACYVRGTQATDQGMYHVYNDADLVIPLLTNNPANASNPRIDLVVARMQDQQYAGAVDLPTIEMVTGVPGASPAVPAAPANSLILAQILIPAASAVVNPTNITDRRVPAGNGLIVLDDILVGTDSRYLAAAAQITFLNTSNVGTNLLPPGLSDLDIAYFARSDTVAANITVLLRLNNIATASYDYERLTGVGAGAAAAETLGATSILAGTIPAASANAGYFGQADVRIKNAGGAVGNKVVTSDGGWSQSDGTGSQGREAIIGKLRTTGAPVTRLDLICGAGNFVVGSRFVLLAKVGVQP